VDLVEKAYTASLLAIEVDTPAKQQYLAYLVTQLNWMQRLWHSCMNALTSHSLFELTKVGSEVRPKKRRLGSIPNRCVPEARAPP
jgi:hypothetical protein